MSEEQSWDIFQYGNAAQHLVPLSQGTRLQLSNRERSLSKASVDAALLSALGTRIPTPPLLENVWTPKVVQVCYQTTRRPQTLACDVDSRT